MTFRPRPMLDVLDEDWAPFIIMNSGRSFHCSSWRPRSSKPSAMRRCHAIVGIGDARSSSSSALGSLTCPKDMQCSKDMQCILSSLSAGLASREDSALLKDRFCTYCTWTSKQPQKCMFQAQRVASWVDQQACFQMPCSQNVWIKHVFFGLGHCQSTFPFLHDAVESAKSTCMSWLIFKVCAAMPHSAFLASTCVIVHTCGKVTELLLRPYEGRHQDAALMLCRLACALFVGRAVSRSFGPPGHRLRSACEVGRSFVALLLCSLVSRSAKLLAVQFPEGFGVYSCRGKELPANSTPFVVEGCYAVLD